MKTNNIEEATAKMMADREKWESELKSQFGQLLTPTKPLSQEELNAKIEKLKNKRLCEDARLVQKYYPSSVNKTLIDQCEKSELAAKIKEMQERRVCEDTRLLQKYFPLETNKELMEACEQQVNSGLRLQK